MEMRIIGLLFWALVFFSGPALAGGEVCPPEECRKENFELILGIGQSSIIFEGAIVEVGPPIPLKFGSFFPPAQFVAFKVIEVLKGHLVLEERIIVWFDVRPGLHYMEPGGNGLSTKVFSVGKKLLVLVKVTGSLKEPRYNAVFRRNALDSTNDNKKLIKVILDNC